MSILNYRKMHKRSNLRRVVIIIAIVMIVIAILNDIYGNTITLWICNHKMFLPYDSVPDRIMRFLGM